MVVVVVCATVVICFAMACAVVLRVSELWFKVNRPRNLAEIFGGRRQEYEEDE